MTEDDDIEYDYIECGDIERYDESVTIVVEVVAVKLNLCLDAKLILLFDFKIKIFWTKNRKEKWISNPCKEKSFPFFSQIFSRLADGDNVDNVDDGDDDDDLDEGERYGDETEAEIGDGEVGDEHIPGFDFGNAQCTLHMPVCSNDCDFSLKFPKF